MSAALRKNPFALVDADRYGWSEPDQFLSERAARRSIVNTFLARRSYWAVLDYLSALGVDRRFLCLDEAVRYFRAALKDALVSPRHGRMGIDEIRKRLVVARYFAAARWEWL